MYAHAPSAVQRWRQGLGAWLALAMLVSALLMPLLAESAVAKQGGKHHRGGHHGQVHRGNDNANKQHCVGELVAGSDEVQHEACYRTFEQAQAAATGEKGRGANAERSTESIVGILYDYVNYTTSGATYTYRMINSSVGCTNGFSLSLQTMPSGWDNRVSSAKVFSGCKAAYYIDSYLSGTPKIGAATNGYDIPNMESYDYKISSINGSKA